MVASKQAHHGIIVFTFLLVFWHPTPIKALSGKDMEFDYGIGSPKGPKHWGDLKKEWVACKDGKQQSPIDLLDALATKLIPTSEDLTMIYKPADATITNEGPAIAIEWEGDAGLVHINGTDYFLKQCHWHSPSEHSINGKRYDLELHMVHQSPNSNLAVVALHYRIGQPNPFLSKVEKTISSMIDIKKGIHLGMVDPTEITGAQATMQTFYRYAGSLTTPPCAEGVTWTVNKEVQTTVSISQVRLLKQAVFDFAVMNARPLQPLNNRDINLYSPSLR